MQPEVDRQVRAQTPVVLHVEVVFGDVHVGGQKK
jgi:hypothetical protein